MQGTEWLTAGLLFGLVVLQGWAANKAARSDSKRWRLAGLIPAVVPVWPVGVVCYLLGRHERTKARRLAAT